MKNELQTAMEKLKNVDATKMSLANLEKEN